MSTVPLKLTTEVKYLKGVGPARAELLASRGILTVEDLLHYAPFRYEDRAHLAAVCDLVQGQWATVLVEVLTCGLMRTRRGVYIYDLAAKDASSPEARGLIRCKWFNALYLERNKVFQQGQRVFFYGKVEPDPFGTGNFQFVQPQFEIVVEENASDTSLEMGRVVPVYESIGAVGPRILRRLIWSALAGLDGCIAECLPPSVTAKNRLLDRARALRLTHFPESGQSLDDLARFRTAAQVRLIFEELFNVSAGLALKRQRQKAVQGIAFQVSNRVREAVKQILPFHPTAAQKRALKEIVGDMCSPRPMNRLLQGDVGSGKTIVALEAAVVAMDNGYQVAFMAPTEILATQHYLYMKQLLRSLPYEAELLTSGRKPQEKKEVKQRLAAGELHLVVGTHALIQRDVEFARLGLVVMDEQHRFGVRQRHELIRKGLPPDVLVMTATPIPRTLALTLYGDLDVSVIDELPPHRTPIETRLLGEPDRPRAFEFIREKVKQGQQAFIVYPVVEESEKLDLQAAVRMYEQLSRTVFSELQLGLLHGRLPSEEKERVMLNFKENRVQVLVSTTVVEVGVDVPNASVMLVEHAERFGLAQLHQLRGRIGRGRARSYCLLLANEPLSEVAQARLEALVKTTDGFKLAELDLKIRGPGEFFGTRQSGIATFRIANLLRDQEILEWAKREASEFVEHPASRAEYDAYVSNLRRAWSRRYRLAGVA